MFLRSITVPFILLLAFSCSHKTAGSRQHEAILTEQRTPSLSPTIIIDPGHGGKNLGAQGNKGQYIEKNLNLTTAYMLKKHLHKMGYSTLMTRNNDTFISLSKRAKIANKTKAQVFVSIHYNWAPTPEAEGIEVFYFRKSSSGRKLAQNTLDKIITSTQVPSRGIKPSNFYVLRNTKMPAILVEGGFLSNSKDLKRVADPNYLNLIAWGVACGIKEYLEQ
ncbi:MAG: N-acetylmuramoyl-L-alanine amidase family protein [Chlamydiota bacterium]